MIRKFPLGLIKLKYYYMHLDTQGRAESFRDINLLHSTTAPACLHAQSFPELTTSFWIENCVKAVR